MAITPSTLERGRVAGRLRRAARRPIVIVHGAAGSGKTVAIRHYLAALRGEHVLFSARTEHAGVAPFARALAVALTQLAPNAAALLPAAYSSARRREKPWDAVAAWLGGQLSGPATIVVDQLHRLHDDEPAFRFLARLIDETSPRIRWMLGTRSTSLLPLPRWLAAGLADASVDDGALRVDAADAAELAAFASADPVFIERLRVEHGGAIGHMLANAGHDAAWMQVHCDDDALVALAALPALDDVVLDRLPKNAAELVGLLERELPFLIGRDRDTGLRILDERIIARADDVVGDADRVSAVRAGRAAAGRALEMAGHMAPALQLYIAASARSEVERMLNDHGFDLIDQGCADVVSAAIASLPLVDRRRSALALTLEATDESFRGRYDVCEAWFENALLFARDDRQRHRVAVAFAIDLLRRGRPDASERLEALAEAPDAGGSDRVLILASLAAAHATAGRNDLAELRIKEALRALADVDDVGIRAVVHQRAAFVALASGKAAIADQNADVAATLAQEHGNDELAAVARSVSHVVAYSYNDDHAASLRALGQIEAAASRLGNAFFRRFALIGSYLIFAERADLTALHELDATLAGEELAASMTHVEEALLPARALRSCWAGDFDAAYQALAFSIGRQPSAETRMLRAAEIALYAAVAGHGDAARSAFRAAAAERREPGADRSVEGLRAELLMCLAAIVLGQAADARDSLAQARTDVERWPRWRPIHALLDAMLALPEDADCESLLELLAAVEAAQLSGWALMVQAIPLERLQLVAGRW